jgi:hypothetical protein
VSSQLANKVPSNYFFVMETKTMHKFLNGDRPKRLKALQRILQEFIRFETPEMAKDSEKKQATRAPVGGRRHGTVSIVHHKGESGFMILFWTTLPSS